MSAWNPGVEHVSNWRLTSPKWVKCSLQFQSQTYIIWKSFRRGVKQRKPFLATTRKTQVMGLERNLSAPPEPDYFASTTQPNTQNSTWRHGCVGQPGPRNTLLTHVKNSTVIVILRKRHSRTRKPEKTNYWKNRDRVTPTYAMASPLGL